jgi:predicted nucleic acid-binding protein
LVLIDTNVWGELTRPRPDERVVEFLAKAPHPVRAKCLLESRNDIVLRVADRILFPDFLTTTVWGKLKAELDGKGDPIATFDLLICAQAIAAGMPVVTRNVGHMARTGARIINPWEP